MNIIDQSHEILRCPTREEALSIIEIAGRTCYHSDCSDAGKFARSVIARGHESVIEHCSLTVRFITDRAVMAELTRHRLASFSIQSQRYVNYGLEKHGGEIVFIKQPNWFRDEYGFPTTSLATHNALVAAEDAYLKETKNCTPAQFARAVLPNCTATNIVMTANFREMRHIIRLRSDNAAHPQMRSLIGPLAEELARRIPEVFDMKGENNGS